MKNTLLICLLGLLCLPLSKLKAQSEVAESPPDTDLVYQSGIPGQEGESPSARMGTEDIILYMELPYAQAPDTLWLTYWSHLLKDHAQITPGIRLPLTAEVGNFFEGSDGYKSYCWRLQHSDEPIFFTLKSGDTELLTQWAVFPGDQARMRFDLPLGQVLMGGPSSEFFSAQAEISRLKAEQGFNSSPLMVSSHPERVLADSSNKARYEQASSRPAAVSVTMQFLVPGQNEIQVILPILAESLQENTIIQHLPRLLEGMTADKAEFLSQRAWAAALSLLMPRLNLAGEVLKDDTHSALFQDWLHTIPSRFDSLATDPMWVQTRYELLMLQGRVQEVGFFDLAAELSQYMQDQLLGRYVLENYRYLDSEQEQVFSKAERMVKTPWITDLLGELSERELKGREFIPGTLTDLDGNAYSLDSLRGKTLVLSFWISGCKFCMKYYTRTLREVFLELKDREDLVFVSINADKDTSRWKESILSDRFTHPDMLQLHQDEGTGILEAYKIVSFPQKLLIDPHHNLFLLTKNQYSPLELISLIEKANGEPFSYLQTKSHAQ
ncbi:Thioredoxin-like [Algoriphagus winogradskyi]|uniref:Thioredoxin-like n=2 Tax=Algoriphagus winogradskyi TaxID=237017 RepID=A0ABY1NW41_9BACT|nr:Thioredoxin-like [Algoriphagus winogradskyi]